MRWQLFCLLLRAAVRIRRLQVLCYDSGPLCMTVLRFLNRFLIRRLLPVPLQSWCFRAQQLPLRLYLYYLLTSLPPTGLFDAALSPASVREFQLFCDHARRVHSEGPRAQLLLRISQRAERLAAANPDVRWLLSTVEQPTAGGPLPLAPGPEAPHPPASPPLTVPINFKALRSNYHNLSPGPHYTRWQKLRSASEKSLTDAQIEVIREGMRTATTRRRRPTEASGFAAAASSSANTETNSLPAPVPASPSEPMIDARIQAILRTKRQVAEAKRREADQMWERQVVHCPHYQRYARLTEIWQGSGLQTLDDEFTGLDQEVGNDRVLRGSKFEEEYEALIFHIIAGQLQLDPARLQSERSLYWYDAGDKEIGEVDLTISVPATRRAVALCEFKTSYYELSAARRQCYTKMARNMQLRPKSTGSEQNIAVDGETPLYVVTTIPKHRFLQGAEPKIIAEVAQYLYSHALDLSDEGQLLDAMVQIRQTLDLDSSPEETLLQFWDRILIIV